MNSDDEKTRALARDHNLFVEVETVDGKTRKFPILVLQVISSNSRGSSFWQQYLKVAMPSYTLVAHSWTELGRILNAHNVDGSKFRIVLEAKPKATASGWDRLRKQAVVKKAANQK